MGIQNELVIFDIEATGLNPTEDAIVAIAARRYDASGETLIASFSCLIKPWRPIPDESVAIHGISEDMVANSQPLSEYVDELLTIFENAVIVGYNMYHLDLPLLVEELHRVSYKVPSKINACLKLIQLLHFQSKIDACIIFKRKEERTLSAAYKFYLNKTLSNAHNADVDCIATMEVLKAQRAYYPDLQVKDATALALYSNYDLVPADLAHKLAYDKDGELIYNFGKNKGKRVKDDLSYADWMLNRDFPYTTKKVLRDALDAFDEEANAMSDHDTAQEWSDVIPF